eukprot:759189-Hanusia_phi.AAC.5
MLIHAVCHQRACRHCKERVSGAKETFLSYLERYLEKQTSRSEYGAKVGNLARENSRWREELDHAGGVKCFCMDNSHKLQYRDICGSGMVVLVDTKSIKQGDFVKVKHDIENPSSGWGEVHSWSMGTVTKVHNGIVNVEFPEQKLWRGNASDLEKVKVEHYNAFSRPPEDARFAGAKFVNFLSSGLSFEGLDAVEKHHQKVGYVRVRQACDRSHAYFEVTLVKRTPGDSHGSIVVGLTEEGYLPGKFAGETSGGIGMSDTGQLLWQMRRDLGPSRQLAVGERMGCGIHFGPDGSKTIYFTLNGKETVRVPWTDEVGEVYPIVCCSSESLLKLDLNALPPPFAPSCMLISKCVEVFDASSKKWMSARVFGPLGPRGTPVLIGDKPTKVEFAQRMRKAENPTEARTEFASLLLGIRSLQASDTVLVKNNSPMEFCKSGILLNHSCAIAGESADTKYCIHSNAAHAIEVASEDVELSFLDLSITLNREVDRSEPLCSAMVLTSGALKMKHVCVSCPVGSAIRIQARTSDKKLRSFEMQDCKIGPCHRHGLVLNDLQERFLVQGTRFESCNGNAIECNRGVGSVVGCSFVDCEAGLLLNQSNADIKESKITSCKQNAVHVCSRGNSSPCKVVLDQCVIDGCACPILAQGEQVHVLARSCQVRNCERQEEKRGGAIIEMTSGPNEPARLQVPTQLNVDVNSKKDNFKRFCKLLLGSGRDILAKVLQTCYMSSSKKSWSDGAGEDIAKELDDFAQRRLGKPMLVKLRSEGIDKWDVTLLTHLLIASPGYIKKEEGKSAVEALRKERNELAHSNLFHVQEMENAEFIRRWARVKVALESLTSLFLQDQKQKLDDQIQAIAAEKLSDSTVDYWLSSLETIQGQVRDVADQVQGIKMKADKAVTMSVLTEALQQFRGNQDGLENPGLSRITLSDETYILGPSLGSGGQGAVYLAYKDETGEKFAMKICHAYDKDRQDREAVILERLMSLKHPNIVRFLGSSYVNKRLFLLMEYIQGISLDDWLDRRKTVTLADSKTLMLQFAGGMSAVHSYNVAHRDLKPSNLIVDDVTDKLVIVDFGLSKQLNSSMTVTKHNTVIGTVMYMSPEHLEGETSAVDLRSDVWAMGVICYEIVAGCTPFQQPSLDGSGKRVRSSSKRNFNKAEEGRLLTAIMENDMPELSADEAPAPFQKVVRKALEKNKEARQVDASEFLRELEEAFAQIEKDQDSGTPASSLIERLTVQEVSAVFRQCCFLEAATAIESNGVDGKTFLMLEEEDLKRSIEDGGLGLKLLQIKRIRKEMQDLSQLNRQHQPAESSPVTPNSPGPQLTTHKQAGQQVDQHQQSPQQPRLDLQLQPNQLIPPGETSPQTHHEPQSPQQAQSPNFSASASASVSDCPSFTHSLRLSICFCLFAPCSCTRPVPPQLFPCLFSLTLFDSQNFLSSMKLPPLPPYKSIFDTGKGTLELSSLYRAAQPAAASKIPLMWNVGVFELSDPRHVMRDAWFAGNCDFGVFDGVIGDPKSQFQPYSYQLSALMYSILHRQREQKTQVATIASLPPPLNPAQVDAMVALQEAFSTLRHYMTDGSSTACVVRADADSPPPCSAIPSGLCRYPVRARIHRPHGSQPGRFR